MTHLKRIQELVIQYAKIISEVVQTDVVIIDTEFCRIAGTGIFEEEINTFVGKTSFVFDYVMKTGQQMIIEEPGNHDLCSTCPKQGNCYETYEISAPILIGMQSIGVIGVACVTVEQMEHIKQWEEIDLEI